jgi:hypothetical protein
MQLKTLTSPPATKKEPSKVKALQYNHAKQLSDGKKKGLETVVTIILAWQWRIAASHQDLQTAEGRGHAAQNSDG